jgi:hypothetical protein
MRKAAQNSFFWERSRAEPIIEPEGGICEVVAGYVSRAGHIAAMVHGCIAAFGREGGEGS